MLLFGESRERHFPDAWIQAGRFHGVDKSRIVDGTEIRAHLIRVVHADYAQRGAPIRLAIFDVLGQAVVVETIDLSGADELIAICRRGGKRQKVRLLDLELPVPRPKGAEWVAAYHRWSRRR